MIVFLRWWFIVCLSVGGAVAAYVFGLFDYFWRVDATKLSFVIMGVFASASIFVGYLTFASRHRDQAFTKHLPFCWYVAELLLGFGMIGTLIGFLMLLQAAFGGGIDLSNAGAATKVLTNMAVGFATAGVTTLVGLACSLIFKAQLINLEYLVNGEVDAIIISPSRPSIADLLGE